MNRTYPQAGYIGRVKGRAGPDQPLSEFTVEVIDADYGTGPTDPFAILLEVRGVAKIDRGFSVFSRGPDGCPVLVDPERLTNAMQPLVEMGDRLIGHVAATLHVIAGVARSDGRATAPRRLSVAAYVEMTGSGYPIGRWRIETP